MAMTLLPISRSKEILNRKKMSKTPKRRDKTRDGLAEKNRYD